MSHTDHTHHADATSWIEAANADGAAFPIQNLPFGRFVHAGGEPRVGVAIGDSILDLAAVAGAGLADDLIARCADGAAVRAALEASALNALMALSTADRVALRHRLFELLASDVAVATREAVEPHLVQQDEARMMVPAQVGDYTDFYASIHHATRVGQLFRPDNPLLPNWRWIPIGYHGRASSIVPSGTPIRRPVGQTRPAGEGAAPGHGPSGRLDYELELGVFVAGENALGDTVDIADAEDRMFGVCLVNDWSARDLQGWEYQPLGPFLGKSFATSVSPWVVTREALAPFRAPAFERPEGDPAPLAYLDSDANRSAGGIDIRLQVALQTPGMRDRSEPAQVLTHGDSLGLYWTFAQMLAHHASNGCNLRPGDLIASGTVSGPEREASGCLLELSTGGRAPITLANGEERAFLEDGDEVVLSGRCERDGFRSIGFGSCTGRVLPAEGAGPRGAGASSR
jgi:fumarylacetoacetase